MHRQRDEDRGDDRHGGERRADAHGDQQADQQHQHGADRLAVADPGHRGVDQALHLAGGLHHLGETGRGDHDETDGGHHLHAFGEQVVGLLPAHHAGQREDHETDQRADDHRVQPQLCDERGDDGYPGHRQALRVVADIDAFGLLDPLQVVDALAAVAEQHRDEQPGEHAQGWDEHGVGDVDPADVDAVARHVGQQDFIEEDVAEAHRQEHVRGDQAEGDDAGDQSPVDLQLAQHIEQRRHQQRDEGDMDRQDILRGYRHAEQQADQDPLERTGALALLVVPAEQRQDLVGQRMGHAGAGDGHGEGAEHGVRQGHRGTPAEAAVEGLESPLKA